MNWPEAPNEFPIGDEMYAHERMTPKSEAELIEAVSEAASRVGPSIPKAAEPHWISAAFRPSPVSRSIFHFSMASLTIHPPI